MQLISIPGSAYEYAVQTMTVEQLRYVGLRQLVYLKPEMIDGERIFVIYGADGIPFEAVDAWETAVVKVARQGLSVVALH